MANRWKRHSVTNSYTYISFENASFEAFFSDTTCELQIDELTLKCVHELSVELVSLYFDFCPRYCSFCPASNL